MHHFSAAVHIYDLCPHSMLKPCSADWSLGSVCVLRLATAPITAWTCTSTVIYDSSPGTIRATAMGDFNHDNYTEIIIPSYDANKITILTYRPGAMPTGHTSRIVK